MIFANGMFTCKTVHFTEGNFYFPDIVFGDEESVVLFHVFHVLENKKFALVSYVEHYSCYNIGLFLC